MEMWLFFSRILMLTVSSSSSSSFTSLSLPLLLSLSILPLLLQISRFPASALAISCFSPSSPLLGRESVVYLQDKEGWHLHQHSCSTVKWSWGHSHMLAHTHTRVPIVILFSFLAAASHPPLILELQLRHPVWSSLWTPLQGSFCHFCPTCWKWQQLTSNDYSYILQKKKTQMCQVKFQAFCILTLLCCSVTLDGRQWRQSATS